ncbi:MAG TPA: sulfurtransferase-like selenium metabolism protein YedF [Syntrophales bacterium]|nr:sulfurtransferase-like selenium metabolism protein YedF [Syntrophales bacterium]
MVKEIDARGLACPQPVILTKKALEAENEVVVLVDNDIAVENVKRLGTNLGCSVTVDQPELKTFRLDLKKTSSQTPDTCALTVEAALAVPTAGPLVVAIGENRMGRGNDELGYILIRSFIHTLLSLDPLPATMIFFNSGVKLTVLDSDVLDDLKELEAKGVNFLVCGTCVNFFGITRDVAVGSISNMYDIAETMSKAGRMIAP